MTSNDEQPGSEHSADRVGPETNLLGEVLSLGPRLASRTISQIQASQQILSMLGCSRDDQPDDQDADPQPAEHAMDEPVDVLGVIESDEAETPRSPSTPQADDHPEQGPGRSDEPAGAGADVPAASELAIHGYDSLAASQVVPRLTTLSLEELEAIGAYEAANRGRRTIINRVRQLRASANGDS